MAWDTLLRQAPRRGYGARRMSSAVYMDAVITPNRSLSQRGFVVLISVITVLNCASAAVFIAVGAHFVPVFLGLDLAAVVVAFLVSFRAAKRVERILVTAREVRVLRETPRGATIVWESPTAFTRVAAETLDDQVVGVQIALSGHRLAVGRALTPVERADFARALERAIRLARLERT